MFDLHVREGPGVRAREVKGIKRICCFIRRAISNFRFLVGFALDLVCLKSGMESDLEIDSIMDDAVLQYLKNPQALVKVRAEKPLPSPEQEGCLTEVQDFLAGDESIFVLSGAAGSGKSYLIPLFEELTLASGRQAAVCAPTGQAAKRLRAKGIVASTVHHILYGEPIVSQYPTEDKPPTYWFKFRGLSTDTVFVVDEASMIGNQPYTEEERKEAEVIFEDGELLNDLLLNIKEERLNNKIIFIGDRNQLPPVKSSSSPCLDPDFLMSAGFQVRSFDLSVIHRTDETSQIRRVAEFCSDGQKLAVFPSVWECKGEVERVVDFSDAVEELAPTFATGETVAVVGTNQLVDSYSRLVRKHIFLGRENTKENLGCVLPSDRMVLSRQCPTFFMRTGDEFVVTQRLPCKDVLISGVRGAKDVNLQFVTAAIEEFGNRYEFKTYIVKESLTSLTSESEITQVLWVDYIRRCKKANIAKKIYLLPDNVREDPFFNAFRAKFSYARTCHKAQGDEWRTVVVDAIDPMATLPAWGYTAATRASSRLIVISRIDKSYIATPDGETVEQILRQIHECGATVELIKDIQNGCQIKVSLADADESVGLINLYFSGGEYSKFVLTSQWDQVKREKFSPVILLLEAKSPPPSATDFEVPQFVQELLERMKAKAMTSHEVRFTWMFSESWTVKITASKEGREGSTFYSFGSKKKGLTQEKIDGRHQRIGDSEMIELIRMLKETRGI